MRTARLDDFPVAGFSVSPACLRRQGLHYRLVAGRKDKVLYKNFTRLGSLPNYR